MALSLFHEAAVRIPAYKNFLKDHNIDHKNIVSIADFSKVPSTNKDNYLRKYRRDELCWDGNFKNESWVISATSGSTGNPFYFPRTETQDQQYALVAELYLRENFNIQDKSTLYIDAFAMGIWIGGLFTYEAIKRVSRKDYNISIVTPGINIQEVINCVKNLGLEFDQIIIGSYPPMLKDIIDLGIDQGIDWGDYKLGIVFSAEGFSEEFRDYIVRKAKLEDTYKSTLNHYGTVDLGTMSHETALTNMVRRDMLKDIDLRTKILNDTKKLPTVTQYVPEIFYFEQQGENIICTSNSGYPLIRYDLKDRGVVSSLQHVKDSYASTGNDLLKNMESQNIESTLWNIPFVSVFDRVDLSISFYGGNIYPEEIKRVLISPEFNKSLSGKFTLEVINDDSLNNVLLLNVELRDNVLEKDVNPDQLIQKIVDELLETNIEYVSNYAQYGKAMHPHIRLWAFGDPEYFSGKGKQKWVKK
jgi:phenylacetate-CoA ligase